jgi:hypothetical protein
VIRLSLPLAITLATACTAVGSVTPAQTWSDCQCEWLKLQAQQIASPGMVDCGFVNLLEDSSRRSLRAGMSCARQAFESNLPFRYGSLRIPHDSYATEILLRTADGTLWLLTTDQMLGEQEYQYWKQKCTQLVFKPRNAGFVISGCDTGNEVAQ